MSNLQVIENRIKEPVTMNNLIMAMGHDPSDEKAKDKARRYAASVLMEIKKTAGDDKKDLTVCTPDSIVQSMIDAARFEIMIDGRQHAHLVKYGNKATLQIGYRGYIYKLSQIYQSPDFTYGPVYEGDEFTVSDENGFQDYKLSKKNPFMDDLNKLKGVYIAISYTLEGRRFQKITLLPKSEIDKIRGTAKQQFIWNQWYIEKALAAGFKRACKVHFASITGLQDMIRYDNENNHVLSEAPPTATAGNIIDNINKGLSVSEAEIVPELPADDSKESETV